MKSISNMSFTGGSATTININGGLLVDGALDQRVDTIHCESMQAITTGIGGDCVAAGTFGYQPGGQFSNIQSNFNVNGATVHLGNGIDSGQVVIDAIAAPFTSTKTILQDDANQLTLTVGTSGNCSHGVSVYVPGSLMTCTGGITVSSPAAPAGFNAVAAETAVGGAGGASTSTITSGFTGGGFKYTTGSGSNGGTTSGTGGAGGNFTVTTGSGGAAAVGSLTGSGGNYTVTLGAAGGTGTPGAPGQFQIVGGTNAGNTVTPTLSVLPIWSTSGAVDAGIFENVNDMGAGPGSLLIDLRDSGVSKFSVDTTGKTTTATLVSTVATGTPPLTVSSTTPVANLALSSASQVPSIPLNQIISPTGAISTFANGNNPVTFTSQITTNGLSALTISEASPATGGSGDSQLTVSTAANSASTPLRVSMGGQSTVFPTAAFNLALGSNTGATNVPAENITATWNNGSISGPLIGVALTNSSSATNSVMLSLNAGAGGATTEFTVDSSGNTVAAGLMRAAGFEPSSNLLISGTTPTISSGFGALPAGSIQNPNGTAAFTIKIGGSTPSTGTIGLPTAASGWNCFATDITSPASGGGFAVKQTGGSSTTAILTGYNSSGVAAAWALNDILSISCFAR